MEGTKIPEKRSIRNGFNFKGVVVFQGAKTKVRLILAYRMTYSRSLTRKVMAKLWKSMTGKGN